MIDRAAAGILSAALLSATPALAQGVPSQMTVGVEAPPPLPHYEPPPVYPYAGRFYAPLVPDATKPRCEQDRLLTADDPCETNPLVRRERAKAPR